MWLDLNDHKSNSEIPIKNKENGYTLFRILEWFRQIIIVYNGIKSNNKTVIILLFVLFIKTVPKMAKTGKNKGNIKYGFKFIFILKLIILFLFLKWEIINNIENRKL